MSVKIRLARAGSKKRPFYRVVVAPVTAPRDGRFIERIGSYNPMLPKDDENRVVLREDRVKYWLSVGAQPTDKVARFLGKAGLIAMPELREKPKKSQPKAKAQERLRAAAEKAEQEAKAAEDAAAKQSAEQENAQETKAEAEA